MGLMELTIRDWMVIVGVLLIVAVLLDAWRRIRSEKYSRVNMKLVDPEELEPEPATDFAMFKELPNGGARVVMRGDIIRAAGEMEEGRMAAAAARSSAEPSQADDVELVAGMSSRDPADDSGNLDWLDGMGSGREREQVAAVQPEAASASQDEDLEVCMLNVVARNPDGFRGHDILHILLACDLRFGEMSFFHRHELEAGRGAIQFSVANMMQPGVFDIDNMTDMTTPGLVFFVTLPGPEDMMMAFDYMLETAQAVAHNLGGDVLDESRSVLTQQTKEHSRQRIRDLERRMLARAR
jgi:cell division protein ZipA